MYEIVIMVHGNEQGKGYMPDVHRAAENQVDERVQL